MAIVKEQSSDVIVIVLDAKLLLDAKQRHQMVNYVGNVNNGV
jgi:hypothetical protein